MIKKQVQKNYDWPIKYLLQIYDCAQLQGLKQLLLQHRYQRFYLQLLQIIQRYLKRSNQKNKQQKVFLNRQDIIQRFKWLATILQTGDYKSIKEMSKKFNTLFVIQLTQQYTNIQEKLKYGFIQISIFMSLSKNKIWSTLSKQLKKNKDPLVNWYEELKASHKILELGDYQNLSKKDKGAVKIRTLKNICNNLLIQAVRNKNVTQVQKLLIQGASVQSIFYLPKQKQSRERPSHISAKQGNVQMMILLDKFGADWEAQGQDLMTPIFYAIISQNMEAIKFLVQQKKINLHHHQVMKRTPFYWACTSVNLDIVRYIYKMGVSKQQKKSALGRTPLSKACFLGKVQLVQYLVNLEQIDINCKCKQGRTPLHNAVFGPKGGKHGKKFGTFNRDSPQCAQILIKNGALIQQKDHEGNTAMHVAASSQGIDSIQLLLRKGGNKQARNKFEQTPLHVSSKFGNKLVTQRLIQQGSDIESKDFKGRTPVQLAIINSKMQIIQIFLKKYKTKQLYYKILQLADQDTKTYLLQRIDIPQFQQKQLIHLICNKKLSSNYKIHLLNQIDHLFFPQILHTFIKSQQISLIKYIIRQSKEHFLITLCQFQSILRYDDQTILQLLDKIVPQLIQQQTGNTIFHPLVKNRRLNLIIDFIEKPIKIWQQKNITELIIYKNKQGISAIDMALMKKFMDIAQILYKVNKKIEFQFKILKMIPLPQNRTFKIKQFQITINKSIIQSLISIPILPNISQFNDFQNRKKTEFLSKIQQLPSQLKNHEVYGVDLQYSLQYPQLPVIALIQISTPIQDFIIDPAQNYYNLSDLLKPIFQDPLKIKIMHGCSTDIRILKTVGIQIVNIFDTAIYQRIATQSDVTVGLSKIAQKYLNYKLNKGFQVAEWRMRPLPRPMLQYASRDSSAPLMIYQRLKKLKNQKLLQQASRASNQSLLKSISKNNFQPVMNILSQQT